MSISGRIGGSSLKVYKYDAFNRLIQYNDSASEATYTYGADNLRASKTINGTKTDFVWNGQNLAGEFQNDTVNTYTYDVTGVHMANQNGTIASYIKDYHGNIVAKANTSGNMIDEMIDRRDYDAFGNHRNGVEADPFGYCGEYLDSESGLIYLRNRYYQAETGRFITEDPVKDGLNWYSYCAGNPVMFADPMGLYNYYIFLGPDQGSVAKAFRNSIKENDKDAKVTYVLVEKPEDFVDEWNKMEDVDVVIVNVHGSKYSISAGSKLQKTLKDIDINKIAPKSMDMLLLLSCNTGNIDGGKYNIASQFAQFQDVNYVVAPDGYNHRSSLNGDGIITVSSRIKSSDPKDPLPNRQGNGYCLYQYIDNDIVISKGLSNDEEEFSDVTQLMKRAKAIDMLNLLVGKPSLAPENTNLGDVIECLK